MKILPSKMCYSFLVKIFFLPRALYRKIFSYREPLPESRIQESIPCPGTPTRVPYIGIDPLPGCPYPSPVYRNRSPARESLPESRIQESIPYSGAPIQGNFRIFVIILNAKMDNLYFTISLCIAFNIFTIKNLSYFFCILQLFFL